MRRDVVIVGYRLNAKEPAPRALERILGLTPDAARSLARSFPAVVRAALPEEQAMLLAARLRDAGAQVELREAGQGGARAVSAAAAPARAVPVPARPPPPPPPAPKPPPPVDEVDDDALEAGTVTTAYRLGDFGLAPTPAARPAPASPKPSAPPRVPGDDLSFDLDLISGPALELAVANENARTPARSSDPPGFDDRFELAADAAPEPTPMPIAMPMSKPMSVTRADEAPQRSLPVRAPRTSLHAARRNSPPPAPAKKSLGDGALQAARGWLPSLALLALLSLGTLVAVGYALDPDHAFALLSPRAAAPLPSGTDDEDEGRHPLLRSMPTELRAPVAAILRARIAGVHALPTAFVGKSGRAVECMLLEVREPDEETRARLDALRRTGSEVPPPAGAAAALREHAQVLRAAAGKPLELTPLCLAP